MPLIVTPIDVGDGGTDEFIDIHVVKASDIDAVDRAAEFRGMSPSERAHAAVLAEQVVVFLGVEQILSEFRFACEQPECVRFDHGGPKPRLGAYRAVAIESTLT